LHTGFKQIKKFGALLGIWAAVFLILLSLDYAYLVTTSVKDDAFYYYQIAHNLWHGKGLTFDGENQTNGFQPLWFICNLFVAWQPNKCVGLKMVLALGFTFHDLTAYVLYYLFRSLNCNKLTAIIGSVLYLIYPVTVMNAFNGMESSLSLLCLVFLLYVIVSRRSERLVILFSILTILARLDYGIFVVLILWWYKPNIGLVKILGIVLLFLIPYGIFNIVTGGSFMPVSAFAVPLVIGDRMHDLFLANPLSFLYYYMIAFAIAILTLLNTHPAIRRLGACFTIGGIAFIVIHIIRGPVRPHYFVYAPLFMMILAVPALISRPIVKVVLACLLVIISVGRDSYAVLRYKQLLYQLPTYQLMTNLTIKDTENVTIGCWNAGIPGFFCRYRVVNLDGCVNNAAYAMLKKHRLIEYCINERIEVIIDTRQTFSLYKDFYGYDVKFDVVRSFGDIMVCTFRKPEEGIQ
jgi:hypothetical protein